MFVFELDPNNDLSSTPEISCPFRKITNESLNKKIDDSSKQGFSSVL